MPELSRAAVELILRYEVAGGRAAYTRNLTHPTWPGDQSGVTIGIGYDLGQQSAAHFEADWGTRLPARDIARLRRCIGAKGLRARDLIPGVRDITVSWTVAEAVFYARSVPVYYAMTARAFPGLERLPLDAQGALVSLVFNRGGGLKDSKKHPGDRREMRAIRELVPRGDLRGIAAQLRSMKRLWEHKHMQGLVIRREEEARLVESAIASGANAPAEVFEPTPAGAP